MTPQPLRLIVLQPTRGSISIETHQALVSNMDGLETVAVHVARKPVDVARNQLAEFVGKIIEQRPDLQSALVLWIDDDAWWQPGTITTMAHRLLGLGELDVLAAWFSKRIPFDHAVAFRKSAAGSQMETVSKANVGENESACEVDFVGAHFIMHRVGLLSALGLDPFSPLSTDITLTEDFAFCRRVKSVGGRIFVSLGPATTVLHVDVCTGLAYAPYCPPMTLRDGSPRALTTAELRELGYADGVAMEEGGGVTILNDAGSAHKYGLLHEDAIAQAHAAEDADRESPVVIFEALLGSRERPAVVDLAGETRDSAFAKLTKLADAGSLPGFTLMTRAQRHDYMDKIANFVGTSRNGGSRRVVVNRDGR
jgi:hypothetical protein